MRIHEARSLRRLHLCCFLPVALHRIDTGQSGLWATWASVKGCCLFGVCIGGSVTSGRGLQLMWE